MSHLILRSNKRKSGVAIAQLGLVPLFCRSLFQVISHHATGDAAEKYWYWISELVFIVLFISLLAGILARHIPSMPVKKILAWGVVALFGVSMGSSYWNTIRTTMPYGYYPADAPYVDIIPTLEANTEPGSLIGMTGGGNTGYFIHDRTIVNMDGLINSKPYFESFQNRTADEFLDARESSCRLLEDSLRVSNETVADRDRQIKNLERQIALLRSRLKKEGDSD